ncbi:hypothetical protein BDZ45DRAFT_777884 [Acephala macrosclerotiorum]|nr:hypothetical protein BDZ45DRAFT_777884 [Acephala macrosclerotiorum]
MVRLQRDDQNDETLAWTQYPAGYPRFAAFISHGEDSSTTIYRRFQRLSARNLLYLESELAELEAEQDRLDQESGTHPDLQLALSSWKHLNDLTDGLLQTSSSTSDQEAGNSETGSVQIANHAKGVRAAASQRLKLAFKIRDVLKSYQEALKLESNVLALSKPDQRPLEGTRRIYMSESEPQPMITGAIKTHLDEVNEGDLCVLAAPIQQDRLTNFLTALFKARTKTGLPDLGSRRRISIVVSILSAGLAITYFLGAILLLYWVDDPNKILGMLCALIVSFAASVAIFTHAQRHEVITATAGYATILIVILSANLRSELLANISISNNYSQETSSLPTITRHISTSTSTTDPSAIVNLVRDPPSPSKIVLGIGLGLGLPLIFAIFAVCIFFLSRGRKKRKAWMAVIR